MATKKAAAEVKVDSGAEKETEPTLTPAEIKAAVEKIGSEIEFSGMDLWAKINWVRANLPASIKNDKTVAQGGGYGVITHSAINQWLRPMLAMCGLIDYASLIKLKTVDTGMANTTTGRKVLHCRGTYDYIVHNAADGTQNHALRVVGWGEDGGDKGPGKAHTYALKTGRKNLFSIAQGDAEEDRLDDLKEGIGRPAYDRISPVQLDEILKVSDELFGDDSEKALQALCESPAFKIHELKAMPAAHFENAITLLERWKKAKDKKAGKNDPATDDDVAAEKAE